MSDASSFGSGVFSCPGGIDVTIGKIEEVSNQNALTAEMTALLSTAHLGGNEGILSLNSKWDAQDYLNKIDWYCWRLRGRKQLPVMNPITR